MRDDAAGGGRGGGAAVVLHVAAERLDGVGEDVEDRFEVLGGASGRAGEGEDEGSVDRSGDASREEGAGRSLETAEAGELHERGVFALEDASCGLGSDVARGEPGAAGADDQIDGGRDLGPFDEAARESGGIVGKAAGLRDLGAQARTEEFDEGGAGGVGGLAAGAAVADCKDGGADGGREGGHGVEGAV